MKFYLSLIFVLTLLSVQAQHNISEARRMNTGETVTVSGIVTNGSELGSIRYLQDSSGGIAAYGSQVSDVNRGDSVTVTGDLSDYNNLLEIQPVASVTVHSSGNQLPEPRVITIGEIGEDYEGQLIRINDVRLGNPSGTFAIGTNYTFISGEDQAELRISSTELANTTMPAGTFDLIGICSQFSYGTNDVTSGYQILPRDANDIILTGTVHIESSLSVKNFTKSTITLFWDTDIQGQSGIFFGADDDPADLINMVPGTSVALGDLYYNETSISGLDPASVVYARGFTVVGSDTAFTAIRSFATESDSKGDIKVYFNTQVDHSVSSGKDAVVLNQTLDDTLIAYINRARESIDMCIYNINNSGISNITDALNNAFNRGVTVRVITCGTTAHLGLVSNGSDIPAFPVLVGPGSGERDGIMHNKFVVFDANSNNPDVPLVWTGSANFTKEQIESDANNVIIVQDQSLAKTYTIEFDEMWGGNGSQPEPANAKFGNQKTDNTPHEFLINGDRVECYFSPSDGVNQQIIHALESANNSVDIATMLITRTDIAETIRSLSEAGVVFHVITDNEADDAATVNSILSDALGSNYIFDDTAPYILHQKYALVDPLSPGSDPLVLTGSHNWSTAANEDNDENTLIVHDAEITNQYYQNFVYRFRENNGMIDRTPMLSSENVNIKVYPNPVHSQLRIVSGTKITKIEVVNLTGMRVMSKPVGSGNSSVVDVTSLTPGLFFLEIYDKNGLAAVCKLMKN